MTFALRGRIGAGGSEAAGQRIDRSEVGDVTARAQLGAAFPPAALQPGVLRGVKYGVRLAHAVDWKPPKRATGLDSGAGAGNGAARPSYSPAAYTIFPPATVSMDSMRAMSCSATVK
jgi:hypothetical protein